jgi:hypothetical protein
MIFCKPKESTKIVSHFVNRELIISKKALIHLLRIKGWCIPFDCKLRFKTDDHTSIFDYDSIVLQMKETE